MDELNIQLPLGYVIKKEPKSCRRAFAMQHSLIDALQIIANDEGTNLNALVNSVLTTFANDYPKQPLNLGETLEVADWYGDKNYFASPLEEDWDKFIKERAGYKCERCGKPVKGKDAQAHHIIPKWFMPRLALDTTNGICLCAECHKKIHSFQGRIREKEENNV